MADYTLAGMWYINPVGANSSAVERFPYKEVVVGSNPASPTMAFGRGVPTGNYYSQLNMDERNVIHRCRNQPPPFCCWQVLQLPVSLCIADGLGK